MEFEIDKKELTPTLIGAIEVLLFAWLIDYEFWPT